MVKQQQTLIGVQYLRGLAALMVVVHHALEESLGAAPPFAPDWLITAGAAGVDVFFVISGFIMLYVSFPEGRPPLRPGQFLLRRVLRIYPFYWLCVLAVLAMASIGLYRSLNPEPEGIIRSLLLLPTEHAVLGVSWTLVYEMYFYLVFAATLFLGSRVLSAAITAGIIGVLYIVGRFAPDVATANFFASAIPLEFCFGMGIALAFRAAKPLLHRLRTWTIPLAVVAIAIAPLFIPHPTAGLPSPIRSLAWGAPAALLVAAFLTVQWRGIWDKIGALLGDASYAIYLTHPFVMVVYARLVKDAGPVADVPSPAATVVLTLASICVGIAAHLIVEKRLVAWTHALTRPREVRAKQVKA